MISFVFLDIGGVVVKDFSKTNKWDELKKKWGVTPEMDRAVDDFWDTYEPQIHKGLINMADLIPVMNEKFNLNLRPDRDLLADFVNDFEKNNEIDRVLAFLKGRTRVGLLTNMYPGMLEGIKERGLLPSFDWDLVINSSLEHTQKPEPRIYEIAEQRCGVSGEQIFFADNRSDNIEAARERGWQTYLYNPADDIVSCAELINLLTKLLV